MANGSTKQFQESGVTLPRWWFLLAVVLTLAMLQVIGWHLYRSFSTEQMIQDVYLAGEQLHDDFLGVHHQASACARRAVAGDTDCLSRYRDLRREVDEIALAFFAPAGAPSPIAGEAAHQRLRELEDLALAQRSDNQQEAHALLSGDEYRLMERALMQAADAYVVFHREGVRERLRTERRAEVGSLGVGLLIFIVSLAVWAELIRRLQRWRRALLCEVTERRQAEAELQQAHKVELLGEVSGGVAHDFNNLLMAIEGYAGLARATLPSEHAGVAPLQRLEQVTGQARGLTQSLLALGQRSVPLKQPVLLGPWLDQLSGTLRHILPAAIDLRLDVPVEEIWVLADAMQLQTLMLNLVVNARDAMPEGGRLEIALHGEGAPGTPDAWACIRVADTGQGIAPEVQSRLFEPFFTTKAPGVGTGLGLPMVRRILVEHGGRVEVESLPGVGSTFTIHLPRVGPVSPSGSSSGAAHPAAGSGQLILVAEDDVYVREIMTTTLSSANYDVEAVDSGSALLERSRSGLREVALMIIDIDLPGRSGLDCLWEMRAGGDRTPAIMVTGNMEPDLEDRLDGTALLLRKPFPMSELVRLVARLLADRQTAGPIQS